MVFLPIKFWLVRSTSSLPPPYHASSSSFVFSFTRFFLFFSFPFLLLPSAWTRSSTVRGLHLHQLLVSAPPSSSFASSSSSGRQELQTVGWTAWARWKLQLPGGFRRCRLVVRDRILHLSLQFLDLGLISWFPILGFLMQFVQFSFNWV